MFWRVNRQNLVMKRINGTRRFSRVISVMFTTSRSVGQASVWPCAVFVVGSKRHRRRPRYNFTGWMDSFLPDHPSPPFHKRRDDVSSLRARSLDYHWLLSL